MKLLKEKKPSFTNSELILVEEKMFNTIKFLSYG